MRSRRRFRTRRNNFFYVVGGSIIFLTILVFVLYKVYTKKLNDISKSMLSAEEIMGLVSNNDYDYDDSKRTSTSLSKKIEESGENSNLPVDIGDYNYEVTVPLNEDNVSTDLEEIIEDTSSNFVQDREIINELPKKELSFEYPVDGEIINKFAMEDLIYSNTLQEWTTHQGIDIKTQRTTVVKAAEEGTVVAIKNDPRYGLTIIIEHQDGLKTIYSNLLTAEFVSIDEHVEKGQSIGTVGNSAAFEIADEPHLHFEIIKDGEYLDPTIYLK